jgi:hypothetical protein
MQAAYVRNKLLLTLWNSSLEIVENLRRMRLVALPDYRDLFYTLYFLKLPTNNRHLSYTVAALTVLRPSCRRFRNTFWASHLKDFLFEVSSPVWNSPDFTSLSTYRFLPGFLSRSDPVVLGLLKNVYFVYLELGFLATRTEIFCEFSSRLLFEIGAH